LFGETFGERDQEQAVPFSRIRMSCFKRSRMPRVLFQLNNDQSRLGSVCQFLLVNTRTATATGTDTSNHSTWDIDSAVAGTDTHNTRQTSRVSLTAERCADPYLDLRLASPQSHQTAAGSGHGSWSGHVGKARSRDPRDRTA
jgi:hypothetical protein